MLIMENLVLKTKSSEDVKSIADKLLEDPSLVDREKFRTFFLEKVAPLADPALKMRVYRSRRAVKILDPRLHSLRKRKRKSAERKLAEHAFASRLGVSSSLAGAGTSGASVARNLKNRPLGLIKPLRQGAFWVKIIDLLKIWIVRTQPAYLNDNPMAGAYAERGAYITAKMLGFRNLMPEVVLLNEGKDGSFMVWSKPKRGGEIHEFGKIQEPFEKRSYKDSEVALFQRFAIFDYLIGNLDRHNWNWLAEIDPKTGELLHVHAIDHDRAFLSRNPSRFSHGAHNQYCWGELKIAEKELLPSTQLFINDQLNERKISAWLQEMSWELPDLMTPAVKERILERVAVLREVANRCSSPKTLSTLWHSSAINNFLKPPAEFPFD